MSSHTAARPKGRALQFSLTLALALAFAAPASAQAVKLEFRDGRVTLNAQNAPIRTILAEWSRLGGTTIVNGDRVAGAPVTIELSGVSERQALDILLRNVSGYLVAARQVPRAGASAFDRILIVPTSTAPRAAAAPAFAPPAPPPQRPQPQPQPQQEDDLANPDNELPEPPRPPVIRNLPVTRVVGQPALGPDGTPVMVPEDNPEPPATTNPFGVQPGSVRPGVIAPPPPGQEPQRQQR